MLWQIAMIGVLHSSPGGPPAVAAVSGGGLEVLPALMQAEAGVAEDPERGLAALRRGLSLTEAGDAAGAQRAFEQAGALVPQLGDWPRVLAADAAARAGDTASVRMLLDGVDPALERRWSWRSRVAVLQHAGDLETAARNAVAFAGDLPGAAARAEAWALAGELHLLRRDTAAAASAYRSAIRTAPGSRAAVDAARALGRLPGLSPEDHLSIGRVYLRHGNIERGAAGIDRYLASGRATAAERAELGLVVGRALFNARKYVEAERRLLALVDASQTVRIAADALFLAGRAQYRQNRTTAGRATFERVAAEYPGEAAAADALFILADLDHDDGRFDSARKYYRRAIETRPNVNNAGLAAMRLGGIAYLEGDFREAASIFEAYRSAHPDGRRYQQASYWAAMAYSRLGDFATARHRLLDTRTADPISYYGMRAADILGESVLTPRLDPGPPAAKTLEAEVAGVAVRLDLLRRAGLADAASLEIELARSRFDGRREGLYRLAETLNHGGEAFTGILLGRQLHRADGAWNDRLLRIVYPYPYRVIIVREARRHGLDPYLVAGLIRQESMFNARAVSPVGAIGLMQIMPATGRTLARREGIQRFSTEMLKQPETNIRLGTLYLADMIRRYGGVTEALVAYNAGPTRIVRWRELPEYQDIELFTERIPFTETRDYVKIVQQNARLYAALYGPLEAPGQP